MFACALDSIGWRLRAGGAGWRTRRCSLGIILRWNCCISATAAAVIGWGRGKLSLLKFNYCFYSYIGLFLLLPLRKLHHQLSSMKYYALSLLKMNLHEFKRSIISFKVTSTYSLLKLLLARLLLLKYRSTYLYSLLAKFS